jgi:hypothetical protein
VDPANSQLMRMVAVELATWKVDRSASFRNEPAPLAMPPTE